MLHLVDSPAPYVVTLLVIPTTDGGAVELHTDPGKPPCLLVRNAEGSTAVDLLPADAVRLGRRLLECAAAEPEEGA